MVKGVMLSVLMASGAVLLLAFLTFVYPTWASTQPIPTTAPPRNAGGDTSSDKIIRVAWTFDDGPHPQTGPMRQVMESKGITATTWFVQYNRINRDRQTKVAKMLEIQRLGGEIGLHSMHPSSDHVAWFPMTNKTSYDNMDTAMSDLETFHTFLTRKGLTVKFVRLPYGEASELVSYLDEAGYEGDAYQATLDIIAGKTVSEKAQQVKADYDKMQAALKSLGLHLWGGSGAGEPETAPYSWQATVSGHKDRSDNLTLHVSAERQRHPNQTRDKPGKFERTVDAVTLDQPGSLIILAHDTFPEDVAEVQADVETMEAYAKLKGVKIEYYTVSGLYGVLRGTPP